MSTSSAELQPHLRAAQGYERAERLEAIEREYGRVFRKTVQESVQPRAARNAIPFVARTPKNRGLHMNQGR